MALTPISEQERDTIFRQAEKVGHIGAWSSDIGYGTEKLIWSEETYRIFGLTPETFHETIAEWLALVHPEDRDAVLSASRAAAEHGIPYSIDHRIVRPDGAVRWVHEQAEVIRDEESKPLRMLGVVQDITERKNNEKALREKEARYREVYENTHDPIVIADILEDGSIRMAGINPAGQKLFNLPEEKLIGKRPEDLFPPDNAAKIIARYKQCYQEKNPLSFEDSIRLPDGEHVLHVTLLPIKDARGRVARVMSISHEMTAFKAAQEALRREREYTTYIVDSAPMLIVQLGLDGTVISINPAVTKTLGYTRKELIGNNWWDLFYPGELRDQVDQVLKDLQNRSLTEWEMSIATKEGQQRDITWTSLSQHDAEGKLMNIIAVGIDRTERKKAEEAQQRLVAIVENTPDYIATFNAENTATYMNDSFKRVLPQRYQQFIDEPWKIPVSVFYPPDGYKTLVELAIPYAIKHGTWQGENKLLDSRGSEFMVLQTVIAHTSEDGRLLYFSTMARDISSIVEARTLKEATEHRYRSMIEQAPYFIQIFNTRGDSVYVNPAWVRFWETTPDQVVGYNILTDPQVQAKDILPLVRQAFAGSPVEIPPFIYDPAQIGKKGRPRWVHSYFFPIKDPSGAVLEIIHIAEDMTDQMKAQETAKMSAQQVEEVQSRAHELELLNKAMVGRELRIVELKAEVQKLAAELAECKKK